MHVEVKCSECGEYTKTDLVQGARCRHCGHETIIKPVAPLTLPLRTADRRVRGRKTARRKKKNGKGAAQAYEGPKSTRGRFVRHPKFGIALQLEAPPHTYPFVLAPGVPKSWVEPLDVLRSVTIVGQARRGRKRAQLTVRPGSPIEPKPKQAPAKPKRLRPAIVNRDGFIRDPIPEERAAWER